MVSNHLRGWLQRFGVSLVVLISAVLMVAVSSPVYAQQSDDQEFDIQVTPATLPVTLKPNTVKKVTVGVRNLSNHSETLTPRLSGFKVDQRSQKITLDHKVPANMSAWVTFSDSQLSLKAGESKNLEITYDTPSNVGFSYTAAITLSRAGEDSAASGTNTSLRGTIAIFNLINIDRPGAKRELTIESLKSSQGTYEFLPGTFVLTVKNTGNVIDQPAGNVFIQRSAGDAEPITTLAINAEGSYILPGNTREITATWKDGFPSYVTKNGEKHLVWNWRNANDLRFGRYIAKAVLVYNDGQRDVPVINSVSFWVLPWRIIIISLILIVVILMGLFGWGRLIAMGTKKVRRYAVHK